MFSKSLHCRLTVILGSRWTTAGRVNRRSAIGLALGMLTLLSSHLSMELRCLAADDRQPPAAGGRQSDPTVAGVQVKVFAIKSGDAQARAEILRGLLGDGSNRAYPLRIAADLRTNSILAVGGTEDLEVIRGILARLDEPAAYRSQGARKAVADSPGEKGRSRLEPEAEQSHNGDAKANEAIVSVRESRQKTQMTPRERDLEEAGLLLIEAKAALDRLQEAYRQNPRAFSASELAKATLAVRSAEVRVERLNAIRVRTSR